MESHQSPTIIVMCRAISEFFLVIVNVLFVPISIGIGIWTTVTFAKEQSGGSPSIYTLLDNNQLDKLFLTTPVYLLILISFISPILCIMGCVGALNQDKKMLTAYSVWVGSLLLIQLVGVRLAVVSGSMLNKELVDYLVSMDKNSFLPYNQLNTSKKMTMNDTYSLDANRIHVSFKCCGVNNYTDITSQDTAWFKANPTYNGKQMKVPASCCILTDGGVRALTHTTDWSNFSQYLPPGSKCPTELSEFHDKGCLPDIQAAVKPLFTVAVVAFSIYIVFYIGLITMSCCLICGYQGRHQLD